jgi:hypothetical protein
MGKVFIGMVIGLLLGSLLRDVIFPDGIVTATNHLGDHIRSMIP